MNIVITAATPGEWQLIEHRINELQSQATLHHSFSFHTSGVGLLASSFSLTKLFLQTRPSLIIQAGIAGSFDEKMGPGSVGVVDKEFLGDLGVEEDELFKDIFDLGLTRQNEPPFLRKALNNPWLNYFDLKIERLSSITVNGISTNQKRIEQLKEKYGCTIENMEGAALHYAGLQTGLPFLQIRGISNCVGDRNKANWTIKHALEKVAGAVMEVVEKINSISSLPTLTAL